MKNKKSKLPTRGVLFLFIILSLCLSVQAWAQSFSSQNIRGYSIDSKGYKISWSSPELQGTLKTKFSYLKQLTIEIWPPHSSQKITLRSDSVLVDATGRDLLLKGNVIITLKTGIIKTNFIKFNLTRRDATSFDNFTFYPKNQAAALYGQGLFADEATHTMQLFGIQNSKPLKIKLF